MYCLTPTCSLITCDREIIKLIIDKSEMHVLHELEKANKLLFYNKGFGSGGSDCIDEFRNLYINVIQHMIG